MPSERPWLPPYLGSWEDLIRALLHDPFLGSGSTGPHSTLPGSQPSSIEPNPSPWRHVVEGFVTAVSVRDLASRVPDEAVRKKMEQSSGQSIVQLLDDYCGTPPRLWPWPWPGPPPWVFNIASELNAIASIMQEGALRNGLQEVAAQVVAKSLSLELK
jgi:hypothetical protein